MDRFTYEKAMTVLAELKAKIIEVAEAIEASEEKEAA